MDKNVLKYFSHVTGEFEISKPNQRKLKLKDINYLRKVREIKRIEKARYLQKLRKIYDDSEPTGM